MQRQAAQGRVAPARIRGAAGLHDSSPYFEHVVRAGIRGAAGAAAASSTAAASCARPIADYEARLEYEIDMIKQMKYPGTS